MICRIDKIVEFLKIIFFIEWFVNVLFLFSFFNNKIYCIVEIKLVRKESNKIEWIYFFLLKNKVEYCYW